MAKQLPTLKRWRVIDALGNAESIQAHYCFNNEDGSITFRVKTEFESYMPASFASGKWVSCVLENADSYLPEEGDQPSKSTSPKSSKPPRSTEYADEIPF